MCPYECNGTSCSGTTWCRSRSHFNGCGSKCAIQIAPTVFGAGEVGMGRFRVATKANPWFKDSKTHDFFTPTYGLKPDLVKEQLRTSIKVLGYVGRRKIPRLRFLVWGFFLIDSPKHRSHRSWN